MQIFIKSLTGRTLALDVEPAESVASLQEKIKLREGIPHEQQRCIYAGKQLEAARPLADYGIAEGATIHLVLRLLGGES